MTLTKPIIPGTILQFTGESIPRIQANVAATVAIPIIHDWGPVGTPVLCESFADFVREFGDSDTPGRTAVAGAFAGQNLQGAGGAGAVLAYRMATGAAADATVQIQNTTPANAIRLTAKYAGVRGNRIGVIVDADPNVVANDRLRITLDGLTVETYSYAKTDIASLAATINQRSNLVTALSEISGTALAHNAPAGTALAGGNDGSVLTSAEWLAAFDGLEFGEYSIIAPFDLTDSAIQASLLSWVQSQNAADRPVRCVVGGAAGEAVAAALTRSAALADPHIVNFGVGTWHDDLLDKDLSTSQLAPRIAGILANRGEEKSLTYAKIGGLHMVGSTGASTDEIESAIIGGVTVLMRSSAADADVRVAKGVTTFTNAADVAHPLDVFSDPRLVGIMDNYIREMKVWGDDTIIGNAPVNDDTRAAVFGKARSLQNDLVSRGLVLTKAQGASEDPFVTVEPPTDPNLLDAIPYQFGWQFARTANYILGEGKIR